MAILINSFEGITVIATAANGKEVIQVLENGTIPDIIILDLNMPKMDGYETSKWLTEYYPEIKILVLTMYDSDIAFIRLLQDGVRGFIKKDIHPNELENAINSVAKDDYYYGQSSNNKLVVLFLKDKNDSSSRLERNMLTEIEIEFLKLASSDMTYKEIAIKMKLTTRSVDSHRNFLFEKFGVRSRVGLVIYAMKNGIVNF